MKTATLVIAILLVSTMFLAACSTSDSTVKDSTTSKVVTQDDKAVVDNVLIPEDDEVEIGELI